MFFRVKNLHFVGIGGIGMSGIAEVLLNLGFKVSGSDLRENATTRRLKSLGAVIFKGHGPENVEGAQVVVISSAVTQENAEVQAAHAMGVPVIPRGSMLAELMRMKYGLAVAGAHGKTTTTSMLATILRGGGKDPTVVIGGRLSSLGSNAKLGQGPFIVAEADESDGSFLLLSPSVALVTNIDPEHLDHYGDLATLKLAFLEFINKVPFFGAAVLCLDNANIQELLPLAQRRVVTYGFSHQADLRPENVRYEGMNAYFDVVRQGERLGSVHLAMPGDHNVLNAVGAIAAAMEVEISFEECAKALQGFTGVGRRFQLKGEVAGVTVIDDYAHHPTELDAALTATRQCFGSRRIIAAFQPHRYSRTRDLLTEFQGAFHQADALLMTDIYSAGEAPIEGISAEALCQKIRLHGHRSTHHLGNNGGILEWLAANAQEGDVLLTLGAGDIWKVGEGFIESKGGTVLDPQG